MQNEAMVEEFPCEAIDPSPISRRVLQYTIQCFKRCQGQLDSVHEVQDFAIRLGLYSYKFDESSSLEYRQRCKGWKIIILEFNL